MVQIFDSLQRTKVPFEPRDAGKVSMYVCGPTVYDAPHLGHARLCVVFDYIRRFFSYAGYDVTFASNVTDIDDNIIKRAASEGRTESEVAIEYTDLYYSEMARLDVLAPDIHPRATDFIDGMIATIQELFDHDAAYVIEGQGVYFDTTSPEKYGQLVGRTREDMLESAGTRIEVDDKKRSPLDFVLWKAAKPGEPTWDTPWGEGRPGWHTECVAMSLSGLGDGFDIHGGGNDLTFPHHENELAQASASGHDFARYWMHNGMVNVDGKKMSKSLGNFTTLADVLDTYDPRALRMVMLQTHYRHGMEVGTDALEAALEGVKRLDAALRRATTAGIDAATASPNSAAQDAFMAAMNDDFSTPAALEVIFGLARESNSAIDNGNLDDAATAIATVVELAGVLGLSVGTEVAAQDDDAEIDALVQARTDARSDRDFAEADRVRDELTAHGITIEDTADGTIWYRA
jgi:cysteinyl-tRNA synthetase